MIKRKVFVFLFVLYLLAGAFPLTSSALKGDSFVVDGITYCVLEDGLAAVGDGEHPAIADEWEQLVIPKTVEYNGEDYTVAQLNRGAFLNCKNLKSLTFLLG